MSSISKYVQSNYDVSANSTHYLSAAASKLIDENVITKNGKHYQLAKTGGSQYVSDLSSRSVTIKIKEETKQTTCRKDCHKGSSQKSWKKNEK